MDPITHAFLGAAVAQVAFPALSGRDRRAATPEASHPLSGRTVPAWEVAALGAAAATLADADVFFRVWSDPALPWAVHRQFTHALAFAPLGGTIAALPFILFRSWRARWRAALAVAILAYVTHGLLDACTSWGTSLFLPFSGASAAWDIIAIVDPFFSAALIVGVLLGARRRSPAPAFAALAVCAAYLGLGARQHAAAMDQIARLAAERGQTIERARAIPTPGNLVLWRGLSVSGGRIHADGIRVPFASAPRGWSGTSVPLFQPGPEGDPGGDPRAARIADVEGRFQRFVDGYAALDPERPDVLADMRYSLEVASFSPLWGIRVHADDGAADPVSWVELTTDRRGALRRLWSDLWRP